MDGRGGEKLGWSCHVANRGAVDENPTWSVA